MIEETAAAPSVLIVDDEPTNIRVLSKLLSGNYRVLVAPNGEKAVEIASGKNPPHLVLLDINLPGMSGYEVCRRLKSNDATRGIAVIFITARSDTADEEKGFRLGAVDYINKPFQPTVVKARVRNHINLKIRTDLLEQTARTDGLTNIPNRRAYDENLKTLWKHCARNRTPISLLMIDIDHFKAYNDHYGHGAGDECLQRVARALAGTMNRPFEELARYGGEEFAAVLPNTGKDGARHVAGTMIQEVAKLAIPHEHSPTAGSVTISIGFASADASPASSPEELAQRADEALYDAKHAGRNCLRGR